MGLRCSNCDGTYYAANGRDFVGGACLDAACSGVLRADAAARIAGGRADDAARYGAAWHEIFAGLPLETEPAASA